jgi:hypothetical protein
MRNNYLLFRNPSVAAMPEPLAESLVDEAFAHYPLEDNLTDARGGSPLNEDAPFTYVNAKKDRGASAGSASLFGLDYNTSTGVTVGGWFKPTGSLTAAGAQWTLWSEDFSNSFGINVYRDNGAGDVPAASLYLDGSNFGTESELTVGDWVHVVGVYTGDTMRLYINGVMVLELTEGVPAGFTVENVFLLAHATMNIDEIVWFQTALNGAQIAAWYDEYA